MDNATLTAVLFTLAHVSWLVGAVVITYVTIKRRG